MNKQELKKDMTLYEFASFMMSQFERFEEKITIEMRTGFAEINLKLAGNESRLYSLEKGTGEIKDIVVRIDRDNKARLEILEDRTVVLKKTIEKELDTKIAW